MRNAKTSAKVARLAAIGVHAPHLLTPKELKSIAASVLAQTPEKKQRRKRGPNKKKKIAK